jgi:hypothetical protein
MMSSAGVNWLPCRAASVALSAFKHVKAELLSSLTLKRIKQMISKASVSAA